MSSQHVPGEDDGPSGLTCISGKVKEYGADEALREAWNA